MENQLEGQDTALYSMPDGKVPGGSLAGYRKAKPALSAAELAFAAAHSDVLSAPVNPARCRSLLTTPFACTVAASPARRATNDGASRALAQQPHRIAATERGKKMKSVIVAGLAITTSLLAIDKEPAKRLEEAASVFSEIMATPDKGIPQDLLEKAHCIVIVPELKTAAFIVGGKYGKGYLSCRNRGGRGWSAPATVRIEGGSVGFQIGGSETDLIMLVMSERGAENCFRVSSLWVPKVRLRPAPLDGQRRLKPTPKCTRRFFRGRGPKASLPVLLWKERPCARIWMTTPRSTARNWRTGTS